MQNKESQKMNQYQQIGFTVSYEYLTERMADNIFSQICQSYTVSEWLNLRKKKTSKEKYVTIDTRTLKKFEDKLQFLTHDTAQFNRIKKLARDYEINEEIISAQNFFQYPKFRQRYLSNDETAQIQHQINKTPYNCYSPDQLFKQQLNYHNQQALIWEKALKLLNNMATLKQLISQPIVSKKNPLVKIYIQQKQKENVHQLSRQELNIVQQNSQPKLQLQSGLNLWNASLIIPLKNTSQTIIFLTQTSQLLPFTKSKEKQYRSLKRQVKSHMFQLNTQKSTKINTIIQGQKLIRQINLQQNMQSKQNIHKDKVLLKELLRIQNRDSIKQLRINFKIQYQNFNQKPNLLKDQSKQNILIASYKIDANNHQNTFQIPGKPSIINDKKIFEKSKNYSVAFQGGGAKGLAYVGVCKSFSNFPIIINNIKNIIGSSAGGIAALALSTGINWREISKICSNMDQISQEDKITDQYPKDSDQYGIEIDMDYVQKNLKNLMYEYGILNKYSIKQIDKYLKNDFKSQIQPILLQILQLQVPSIGQILQDPQNNKCINWEGLLLHGALMKGEFLCDRAADCLVKMFINQYKKHENPAYFKNRLLDSLAERTLLKANRLDQDKVFRLLQLNKAQQLTLANKLILQNHELSTCFGNHLNQRQKIQFLVYIINSLLQLGFQEIQKIKIYYHASQLKNLRQIFIQQNNLSQMSNINNYKLYSQIKQLAKKNIIFKTGQLGPQALNLNIQSILTFLKQEVSNKKVDLSRFIPDYFKQHPIKQPQCVTQYDQSYQKLRKNIAEQSKKLTMRQYYLFSGIELTLTSVDLDNRILRFLNHKTTPDLPVCRAVQMSGSFPFAFKALRWKEEWGNYHIQRKDDTKYRVLIGHQFTDGGVLANLPIKYFDNKTISQRYFSHRHSYSESILMGFGLDQLKEDSYQQNQEDLQKLNKKKILLSKYLEKINKPVSLFTKIFCCSRWFCFGTEKVKVGDLNQAIAQRIPLLRFVIKFFLSYPNADRNLNLQAFYQDIIEHYIDDINQTPVMKAINQKINVKQISPNYTIQKFQFLRYFNQFSQGTVQPDVYNKISDLFQEKKLGQNFSPYASIQKLITESFKNAVSTNQEKILQGVNEYERNAQDIVSPLQQYKLSLTLVRILWLALKDKQNKMINEVLTHREAYMKLKKQSMNYNGSYQIYYISDHTKQLNRQYFGNLFRSYNFQSISEHLYFKNIQNQFIDKSNKNDQQLKTLLNWASVPSINNEQNKQQLKKIQQSFYTKMDNNNVQFSNPKQHFVNYSLSRLIQYLYLQIKSRSTDTNQMNNILKIILTQNYQDLIKRNNLPNPLTYREIFTFMNNLQQEGVLFNNQPYKIHYQKSFSEFLLKISPKSQSSSQPQRNTLIQSSSQPRRTTSIVQQIKKWGRQFSIGKMYNQMDEIQDNFNKQHLINERDEQVNKFCTSVQYKQYLDLLILQLFKDKKQKQLMKFFSIDTESKDKLLKFILCLFTNFKIKQGLPIETQSNILLIKSRSIEILRQYFNTQFRQQLNHIFMSEYKYKRQQLPSNQQIRIIAINDKFLRVESQLLKHYFIRAARRHILRQFRQKKIVYRVIQKLQIMHQKYYEDYQYIFRFIKKLLYYLCRKRFSEKIIQQISSLYGRILKQFKSKYNRFAQLPENHYNVQNLNTAFLMEYEDINYLVWSIAKIIKIERLTTLSDQPNDIPQIIINFLRKKYSLPLFQNQLEVLAQYYLKQILQDQKASSNNKIFSQTISNIKSHQNNRLHLVLQGSGRASNYYSVFFRMFEQQLLYDDIIDRISLKVKYQLIKQIINSNKDLLKLCKQIQFGNIDQFTVQNQIKHYLCNYIKQLIKAQLQGTTKNSKLLAIKDDICHEIKSNNNFSIEQIKNIVNMVSPNDSPIKLCDKVKDSINNDPFCQDRNQEGNQIKKRIYKYLKSLICDKIREGFPYKDKYQTSLQQFNQTKDKLIDQIRNSSVNLVKICDQIKERNNIASITLIMNDIIDLMNNNLLNPQIQRIKDEIQKQIQNMQRLVSFQTKLCDDIQNIKDNLKLSDQIRKIHNFNYKNQPYTEIINKLTNRIINQFKNYICDKIKKDKLPQIPYNQIKLKILSQVKKQICNELSNPDDDNVSPLLFCNQIQRKKHNSSISYNQIKKWICNQFRNRYNRQIKNNNNQKTSKIKDKICVQIMSLQINQSLLKQNIALNIHPASIQKIFQQGMKENRRVKSLVQMITCSGVHSIFGFMIALGIQLNEIRNSIVRVQDYIYQMFDGQKIKDFFEKQGINRSINNFTSLTKSFKQELLTVFQKLKPQIKDRTSKFDYEKCVEDVQLLIQEQQSYYTQTCNRIFEKASKKITKLNKKYLDSSKTRQIAKMLAYNYQCSFKERHQYQNQQNETKKLYLSAINQFYDQFGSILSTIFCQLFTSNSPVIIDPDLIEEFTKGALIMKLYTVYKLKAFIYEKLAEANLPRNITLQQFYERCPEKIVLNFTVINVSQKRLDFFNKGHTPKMPLWAAIIASSSNPIIHRDFWCERQWQQLNENGQYHYNKVRDYFRDPQIMNRKNTFYNGANYLSSLPVQLLTNMIFRRRSKYYNICFEGVTKENEKKESKKVILLTCAFTSKYSKSYEHLSVQRKWLKIKCKFFCGKVCDKILSGCSSIKDYCKVCCFVTCACKCGKDYRSHYNTSYQKKYSTFEAFFAGIQISPTVGAINTLVQCHDNLIMKQYYNKLIKLPIKFSTLNFKEIIDEDLKIKKNLRALSKIAEQTIIRSEEITSSFIHNYEFRAGKNGFNKQWYANNQNRFHTKFDVQIIQIGSIIIGVKKPFLKITFLNHSSWNRNEYNNFALQYAPISKSTSEKGQFIRVTGSQILCDIELSNKILVRFCYYYNDFKFQRGKWLLSKYGSRVMFNQFEIDFTKIVEKLDCRDIYCYQFDYAWNQLFQNEYKQINENEDKAIFDEETKKQLNTIVKRELSYIRQKILKFIENGQANRNRSKQLKPIRINNVEIKSSLPDLVKIKIQIIKNQKQYNKNPIMRRSNFQFLQK